MCAVDQTHVDGLLCMRKTAEFSCLTDARLRHSPTRCPPTFHYSDSKTQHHRRPQCRSLLDLQLASSVDRENSHATTRGQCAVAAHAEDEKSIATTAICLSRSVGASPLCSLSQSRPSLASETNLIAGRRKWSRHQAGRRLNMSRTHLVASIDTPILDILEAPAMPPFLNMY